MVLETRWTATLAAGAGGRGEGDRMRARVAQVFEFRNGLIFRIRSYDCFDPW